MVYRVILLLTEVYLFLALTGCVSVRPYPICYCNISPTQADYDKVEKDLSAIIKKYDNSNSSTPKFSPDHKWAIVELSKSNHKKLEKIWPRLACIGKSRMDSEMEKYKRCIEYIKQTLKERKYEKTEDKRPGYLYCDGVVQ